MWMYSCKLPLYGEMPFSSIYNFENQLTGKCLMKVIPMVSFD